MTTLIETLKRDALVARRVRTEESRVTANLLTSIIGESETASKSKGIPVPSDADVIAVIKRFIDKLQEVKPLLEPSSAAGITNSLEIEVASKYMPQMLTEDEIRSEIEKLDVKTVPTIMAHLKKNFAGKYDGKLASTIAKEFQ